MTVYYNEFDPFAAQWLRELIKEGLIADGIVDDRSILDVEPKDLEGFTQHHFFAGIGGWSYALRLAGWPDSRPVCTASLPCQPFSVAGQNLGKDDERHLLPHFMQLVRDFGKFDTIMGEQVEGAVRHGWLDDLQANMEAEGYTTGGVVLGAHSVHAPHQRQRLYWVADSKTRGWREEQQNSRRRAEGVDSQEHEARRFMPSGTTTSPLADSGSKRQQGQGELGRSCDTTQGEDRQVDRVVDASGELHEYHWRHTGRTVGNTNSNRCKSRRETTTTTRHGNTNDAAGWDDSRLIYCRDGKYRPIPTESCLQSVLPDGFSHRLDGLCDVNRLTLIEAQKGFPLLSTAMKNRTGILRGAGNAIVPAVAAEVIRAFMGDR